MINVINKLKQSDLPSLEEGGERLSLLELNALVRRSLEQCLPDEYWIQAELSDVRSNTTGHCYLEFVQKDPRSNNLVAKARGMIWNNIYRLLNLILRNLPDSCSLGNKSAGQGDRAIS